MTIQFNKNKITELRGDLSQYEFGKIIGTSRQRIHAWEEGISKPNIGVLVHIANTFNVPINFFFEKVVDNTTYK